MTSLPASPKILSRPPSPQITSRLRVPRRTSFFDVPRIVHFDLEVFAPGETVAVWNDCAAPIERPAGPLATSL